MDASHQHNIEGSKPEPKTVISNISFTLRLKIGKSSLYTDKSGNWLFWDRIKEF